MNEILATIIEKIPRIIHVLGISMVVGAITIFFPVELSAQPAMSNKQASQRKLIKKLLESQIKCWNEKNIEGFMETYWNSPYLTFSGGGKTTRGWEETLLRYKKGYPKNQMGQLKFGKEEITMLSNNAAMVLGNWYLEMDEEKKQGNFTLILRFIDKKWKIVHDHSSTLEPKK